MDSDEPGVNRPARPFADPAVPAPGRLELVRSFLNSAEDEHDWDELGDVAVATAWLRDAGLLPAAGIGEADRARLVALRADLRALAAANGDPGAPDRDRVNAVLRAAPVVAQLDADGRLVLEPAGEGAAAMAGTLLGITAAALLDGSWSRLKTCRGCGWGFWDRSRNRSGRWCAMRVCGSRTKMRAYRRRHGG
jgi:predicted RNA-binding Zn ribbon-like protein